MSTFFLFSSTVKITFLNKINIEKIIIYSNRNCFIVACHINRNTLIHLDNLCRYFKACHILIAMCERPVNDETRFGVNLENFEGVLVDIGSASFKWTTGFGGSIFLVDVLTGRRVIHPDEGQWNAEDLSVDGGSEGLEILLRRELLLNRHLCFPAEFARWLLTIGN